MLSRQRRIPRKEFPYILSHSKRFHSPHFILYVCPLPLSGPSRFSFSISKKIFKHAVDRNTYRRRGYSVIKEMYENVSPGYYLFFSFKKGVYPLSFFDLKNEVHTLLSGLSL